MMMMMMTMMSQQFIAVCELIELQSVAAAAGRADAVLQCSMSYIRAVSTMLVSYSDLRPQKSHVHTQNAASLLATDNAFL